MKIVNRTKWNTKHLKAIAMQVARTELDAEQRKRYTIIFSTGSPRGSSGWANLGTRCCVRIASTKHGPLSEACRIDLCVTIAHEFRHLRTRHHGRSVEIRWRRSVPYGRPKTDEGRQAQRELYAWVLDMPLEPAEPKRARKVAAEERDALAMARIEAATKRWTTKLRRAKTALAKLSKKQKYYQ